MPPVMSRARLAALLAAIFALALALRLLGLRLGLPYIHHWDEGWVVDSARSMLEKGDDVPTSYQYGAPLSRLIVYGAPLWQWLFPAAGPLPQDPVALRWIGRAASVAVCVTGVLPAYMAGRRAAGAGRSAQWSGLCSALLYAVAWQLVLHARYAVTDAPMAALCTWSLGATAVYLESRRLRWALLGLLFAGLAFAFKLPGLPVCIIPISALVFVRSRAERASRRAAERALLVAAVPLVLAVFLAGNPHFIDRWAEALRDVTIRVRQMREGGFPSVYIQPSRAAHLAVALRHLALTSVQPLAPLCAGVVAVALWGLARAAFVERRAIARIAGAFAVLMLLASALSSPVFLVRNYLMVAPGLCVGFGAGAAELGRRLRQWAAAGSRGRKAAALALAGAALLALVGPPLADAAAAQALAEDARVRALRFIAERAGAGPIRVALTSSVIGKNALGGYPQVLAALEQPSLVLLQNLDSCAAARAAGAAYVVTASYRALHRIDPYEEQWLFKDCEGYDAVAYFPVNTHEHPLIVSPTWDGRSSVRVLARRAP